MRGKAYYIFEVIFRELDFEGKWGERGEKERKGERKRGKVVRKGEKEREGGKGYRAECGGRFDFRRPRSKARSFHFAFLLS